MQAISDEELERMFDNGEDVMQFADLTTVRRPNQEQVRRISMDLPEAMARGIDRAAARMGVDGQSVIKVWLAERLDEESEREARRLATA